MKTFLWLILLLGCGCFYLRNQQPQIWNSLVGNASTIPPATTLTTTPKKFFIPPDPYPAQPNWNWTTSEGKSYQNVVVKKVEADCVTILDENGGARIDIATLPPDIQKQLNYDPELALEASQKRSKTEAADAVALEQERRQVAVLQEKEREVEATNSLVTASDPSSYPSALSSPTEASSSSSSGPVVVESYDYGQDLILVRRHLHFDPVTGRPDGDPYYLHKYEEDNRAIAEKERRGENASRTDRSHEGFPTLTAPTAETARTSEAQNRSASTSTVSASTAHSSTTSTAKPPVLPPPQPPRPPPLPKTSS